jgi:hypothetical protein
MAEADGFEGLSDDTASLFSSSFDLPVTTQKQFEEIMDVVINYNKNLADQFEARKSFFSKLTYSEERCLNLFLICVLCLLFFDGCLGRKQQK